MEQATTVLLVRHGHVDGIDPPRFRGRIDLPLTALGRRQAEALRDRIVAEWRPAAIYSSPMGRCIATAAAIAAPYGLVPEAVDGCNDLDCGDWQGLGVDEVRARWPVEYALWRSSPDEAVIPGGEGLKVVATRGVQALHAIVGCHRGDTVVVVAHNSVNRVLLLHALGLPLARYWDIAQAPCALNVLRRDGGRMRVVTLNETGHLAALSAMPRAGVT